MIASPAAVLLTVLLALTGLYCLGHFLSSRRTAAASASGALSFSQRVDVNHAVMSVAMIVMCWMTYAEVVLWAQVILFALLALTLIPAVTTASGIVERTDVATHLALDAAMIWMLAAMPALMAGSDMVGSDMVGSDMVGSDMAGSDMVGSDMAGTGGSHHAGHGGGAMDTAMGSTTTWVDPVNMLFVVACLGVTAWWIVRMLRWRGQRLHSLCHTLMGAGMAAMLLAMNA